MKANDLRPDKMILYGLKTLGGIGRSFYSAQKQEAKAHAELTYIGEEKSEKVHNQLCEFNVQKVRLRMKLLISNAFNHRKKD